MNKIKTILLLLTCLSMTACAQEKTKSNAKMKILVAYFSATGTTRAEAQRIARTAGADLFEIEPVEKYTAADLDWHNQKSRTSVEMKNGKSRPAVKSKMTDMNHYDLVIIGFPVWWYTAPTIINTFLDSYNLKGKKIAAFVTSGGSSVDGSEKNLKAAYPQAIWLKGKTCNGESNAELKDWLNSICR